MAEEEKKKDEDWMQKKWRPAMGWMYMIVCMMDMVVFPILWSILQAVTHTPITQWNPLTLQGAGLFHLAMGAVLGISAFGRTQEKLAGTAVNPTTTTQNINVTGNTTGVMGNTTSVMTAPTPPVPRPMVPRPATPPVADDGMPDPTPNPRFRD